MNNYFYEFILSHYDPSYMKESEKLHGVVYAKDLNEACSKVCIRFPEGIYDLHISDTDSTEVYIFEDTGITEGNLFEVEVIKER